LEDKKDRQGLGTLLPWLCKHGVDVMIIGFCGALQHGKTTAAMHLVAQYGWTRLRFAGPLKDMMRALGLEHEEIEGNLKDQPCTLLGGKTPRYAMQTLGTEWGREMIHPDLWSKAWTRQAETVLSFDHNVVCDDVRFPNELEAIHHFGGKVYKIVRPINTTSGIVGHASESMDFEPDGYINNRGTILQLHLQVDGLV
jgi:hypothetical protein